MNRGFQKMFQFPLLDALLGRRSRRVFMGAEIPDGVLRYRSQHDPRSLDRRGEGVDRHCLRRQYFAAPRDRQGLVRALRRDSRKSLLV